MPSHFRSAPTLKYLPLGADQHRPHLRVFVAFDGGLAQLCAKSLIERIATLGLGQGDVRYTMM